MWNILEGATHNVSTVTDKVHEYERVIKGDRRVYKKKEEEESILYHFSNLIFEECVGRKKFCCLHASFQQV